MTKKISLLILSVSLSFIIYILFNNSITPELAEEQYESEIVKKFAIYNPIIPENINFAGEPVPLDNFDIKESLDNEMLANAFWHSQMIRFLKRANRYFPIIEPILKKNNIPDDFKYLAVAESGLVNVVSPSKATGFWQFLQKTAKEYHLEINNEVDERYHIEKSTQAACEYLNEAYQKFGSWTLVAASYNMGMGGLSRQLERQKVDSYYDLYLNRETSRYVFRILAIKTIMQSPTNYGFNLRKKELYPSIPTTIIHCDTTISDLRKWSLEQGINYKILKLLNPWLRKTYLKNIKKKDYQIKITEKGFRNFANSNLDKKTDQE